VHRFQTFLTAVDDATGFTRWGPDSNPLIRQIKREDRAARMTLRRTLWAAWGLGMLGMFWATWDVLTITRAGVSMWTSIINLFGWTLLGFAPLFSAMTAARHTNRQLRPEHFDLVYITPLDNLAVVRARVFDVLFQQRRQLMVLIGLMPYMVGYAFYFFLRLDQHMRTVYYFAPTDVPAPKYWSVVGPTLWVLAIILGQWGNVLLGAVWGVRMGIFRRSAFSSVSVALVTMILILFTPCICLWGVAFLAEEAVDSVEFVFMYIVPVAFLITPWLLAWKLIEHTAWVWKRDT